MHRPREVVDVLRDDGPPGEHEGLAVADILVHQRLGVKPLFRFACRGPVDEHGRVARIPAGDFEEVVPAVHVLIALGRVLHIGVSEDIPIVSSVLVHIHALQSGKTGTPIPKMVGPPDRDAARRPEREPGHFRCRLVGVSLPEPVFLRIDLAACAICGGVFS